MFFEPALFGVTGATIRIDQLGSHLDYMGIGIGIIVATGIVRIIVTALIAFGDNLNLKEKVRTDLAAYIYFLVKRKKLFPFFRYFVRWHAWQKRPFKRLSGRLY